MNSGVSDKISCIQMRMDDPPCQGSAVLPLSLATLWVVLWLDTIFLLAGLDGETEGNKVRLIYSPAGVYEPLVVPPLGAEMLSHGRAP